MDDKAKRLAYEWYLKHEPYFKSIKCPFDWESMGERSQEYWRSQNDL